MKVLILSFILFLSPLKFALSQPYMTRWDPQMVIFLVHGFMSSPNHFCDLEEVLKSHLARNDVVVKSISYPTRGVKGASRNEEGYRHNVNIPYFSKKVFQDILNFYHEEDIRSDVPYAIVAHSQGALISLRFLLKCIEKNEPECNQLNKHQIDIPKNLSHFFTIMPPLWGSTTASFLKETFIGRSFFPRKQLKNLSVGSDIITEQRKRLIALNETPLSIRSLNPQIINIVANTDPSWIESLISRISRRPTNGTLESDLVVPLPSARMDFFYQDLTTNHHHIKMTRYADYYYALTGNHSKVVLSRQSLACVNRVNFEESPIFAIIRRHLMDSLNLEDHPIYRRVMQDEEVFSPNIESFGIEIKMNLPQGYSFLPLDFQRDMVKISTLSPMQSKIQTLKRPDDLLNYYSNFNVDHIFNKNYVTYFQKGTFYPEHSYRVDRDFKSLGVSERESLIVQMKSPWFEDISFVTEVAPSYTTFIELNLVPK